MSELFAEVSIPFLSNNAVVTFQLFKLLLMHPVLMENYVLLMVTFLKDVLRFASTINGAQSVMISGTFVMLEWHVVN